MRAFDGKVLLRLQRFAHDIAGRKKCLFNFDSKPAVNGRIQKF